MRHKLERRGVVERTEREPSALRRRRRSSLAPAERLDEAAHEARHTLRAARRGQVIRQGGGAAGSDLHRWPHRSVGAPHPHAAVAANHRRRRRRRCCRRIVGRGLRGLRLLKHCGGHVIALEVRHGGRHVGRVPCRQSAHGAGRPIRHGHGGAAAAREDGGQRGAAAKGTGRRRRVAGYLLARCRAAAKGTGRRRRVAGYLLARCCRAATKGTGRRRRVAGYLLACCCRAAAKGTGRRRRVAGYLLACCGCRSIAKGAGRWRCGGADRLPSPWLQPGRGPTAKWPSRHRCVAGDDGGRRCCRHAAERPWRRGRCAADGTRRRRHCAADCRRRVKWRRHGRRGGRRNYCCRRRCCCCHCRCQGRCARRGRIKWRGHGRGRRHRG